MFATLPQHAELGLGLADFDLVGFQTERDAENFRNYLIEFLGAAAHGDELLTYRRHQLRVAAFPVGIDHGEFAALAECSEARAAAARLRECLGDRALVLGADRMDYTKGLPHRLRGFERLLRDTPELHRRVSLLQIASPSRVEVPAYRAVATEVDRVAGRINGAFGELDWTPVQHLSRFYPREVIGGFCRLAGVGLVTSLHDGMNLVAKEYVAAQDPTDPGVLVLSRFAGAADQLDAALLVNPHDPDEIAAAIRRAIDMPLSERRRRWETLDACVRHEDAGWWQRSFLGALQTARPAVVPLARPLAGDLAAAG
jgi:trehalose 6-phosphate synthase